MHIYAAEEEGKRCETTTHESRLAMQEESGGAGRRQHVGVGEVLQAACRKEMQHQLHIVFVK
jgi:hypothetical protein